MHCHRCERTLPPLGLRCPVCRNARPLWYGVMAALLLAFLLFVILVVELAGRL
jgi:hypothetical protein